MKNKLAIGFITYEQVTYKYLEDFIPSLLSSLDFLDKADYEIMVFDNSSEDNLNRLALEYYSVQNQVKINYYSKGENIGFARAYNYLFTKAKQSHCEYFLMLNPDTVLDDKAITELLEAFREDKDLVVAIPKLLYWDYQRKEKTNYIDSCGIALKPGLRFKDLGQGELDHGQYDKALPLGPSGAGALFALAKLEKIRVKEDYFDSRFFMYKEDCDLAYRLNQAQLKQKFVPQALIYHDRTAVNYGVGIVGRIKTRLKKSKFIKKQSFYGQHLLFSKYFKAESLFSQLLIILQIIIFFLYSLLFERYNLRAYKQIKG